jgi:hypothetical protein
MDELPPSLHYGAIEAISPEENQLALIQTSPLPNSRYLVDSKPSSYTIYTHSAFAAAPPAMAGNFLFIELPKTALDIFKIVAVELAESRRQATMVNRASLMQTSGHVCQLISDANKPTPLFLLRRCRDDEIKSMRELLVDDYRPRE